MNHKINRRQTKKHRKLAVALTVGILVGIFGAHAAFLVFHLDSISSPISLSHAGMESQLKGFSTHRSNFESKESSDTGGAVKLPMIHTTMADGVRMIFDSLPDMYSSTQQSATILKQLIQRTERVRDSKDVVLTTHISPNKLNVLLTQLKYWGGPASVAVYVKDQLGLNQFFHFWQENQEKLKRTSFHFVIEKNTTLLYPHNLLRNVAVDAVESDYVLALDVDFIPFPRGCHDRVMQVMQSNSSLLERKKTLFILPAFQIYPKQSETHAKEEMLPSSNAEIKGMIEERKMSPFHVNVSYGGHGPTHFKKWLNRQESQNEKEAFYDIAIDARESTFFEPYVLAYKQGLPKYWEGKLRCHAKDEVVDRYLTIDLSSSQNFEGLERTRSASFMNALLLDTNMPYWMIFTVCIWTTLRLVEPKMRRRLYVKRISMYGASFGSILPPCTASCQNTIAAVAAATVTAAVGNIENDRWSSVGAAYISGNSCDNNSGSSEEKNWSI